MATHSTTLAWEIPWTEASGGLQSMGHKESDMTEQLRIQAPPHTSRDEDGFLGKVTAKENKHTHTQITS